MENNLCLKPATNIVLASRRQRTQLSVNPTYQQLTHKQLAYQKELSYWVPDTFLTSASHL